ncbi:AIF_collapsed_G0031680.mRNA.1.CDS.1 [Saccharomyces cerevisiae]|nr:AIF_collapsed_G0031680.mRNA.1.CDS.1 [Saccharomyces cerevisiae]
MDRGTSFLLLEIEKKIERRIFIEGLSHQVGEASRLEKIARIDQGLKLESFAQDLAKKDQKDHDNAIDGLSEVIKMLSTDDKEKLLKTLEINLVKQKKK